MRFKKCCKTIVNKKRIKIPELFWSQFDGLPLDWFCFLNKYDIKIDKTELIYLSKLYYLRESDDSIKNAD